MALIAVFLHACRQEDFGNKTGTEATTYLQPKELKADDLLNNPVLYKEVQSLQAKLSSTSKSNTAGYTLETNRFIELKNNNRTTYTFTLTPSTKDDKLYNVAVSIGNNGTVESSVFIYNKQIRDNYTSPTFETVLRNNIVASSFDDFVNGPTNSLIDPTPICIENIIAVHVYIAPTRCTSGEHTIYDGANCIYWGGAGMATAGSDYYTFSYVTTCTTGGNGPSVPSAPSGGGGGGGDTVPYGGGSGSEDPDDPCKKTKAIINNLDIAKINNLKEKSKVGGENAFKVSIDGVASPIIEGTSLNTVNLGTMAGYKGAYHSHPPIAIRMFSPQDILLLFQFGIQPNSNPNDAFMGLIASETCTGGPNCENGYKYSQYIIRLNGLYGDIYQTLNNISGLDYTKLLLYQKHTNYTLSLNPEYAVSPGADLNDKGVEKLLFETLRMMNIDPTLIALQKVDKDGKVYNIIEDQEPTPCP